MINPVKSLSVGYIPYAYKFSQDFIFTNFANQQAFTKMKTQRFVRIRYKFAAAGRHAKLKSQNLLGAGRL